MTKKNTGSLDFLFSIPTEAVKNIIMNPVMAAKIIRLHGMFKTEIFTLRRTVMMRTL
ncbi:MAG: hypothetical protein LBH98_01300 [Chitinispirillales bacterium]|jgi:hypothetical protein|nr:hypothetical protein [Chitinispirillales bacterium]